MWTRNDNWSSLPFMDQLTHSFVPTFSPLSFLPFLFFSSIFSSLSLFSSLSSSFALLFKYNNGKEGRMEREWIDWKREDWEDKNDTGHRGMERKTHRSAGGTFILTSKHRHSREQSEREKKSLRERDNFYDIFMSILTHHLCIYMFDTKEKIWTNFWTSQSKRSI